MMTYYLGREEVRAYANDLISKLNLNGINDDFLCVAIGGSGEDLACMLSDAIAERGNTCWQNVDVIRVDFNRDDNEISFYEPKDEALVYGRKVLVLDSAVHSGRTMLKCCDKMHELGAEEVYSYSLAVKQTALFIPTFFGVLISKRDRIYFLLNEIPSYSSCFPGPGLRKLDAGRFEFDLPESGLTGRVYTIDDLRSYDSVSENNHVYLCAKGILASGAVGIYVAPIDAVSAKEGVTMIPEQKMCVIDILQTSRCEPSDAELRANMLEWVETYAKSHDCSAITILVEPTVAESFASLGYKVLGRPATKPDYCVVRRQL